MEKIYILIIMFFIYAFLGWLMEIIITLFQHHRFINRGFLIGPLCPIYGVGSVLIYLSLNKYADDPLVLFLIAIILCAILEYFTSYIMEKIFKNRWWDYSNMRFNINGRICLECAIPFGVGGVIMFYGINPLAIKLLSYISLKVINIICIILITLFILDLIISFNVIINLKNISNSIKCDSTELITKKVKEIIMSNNILLKRLLSSFPDMRIYNKLVILKKRLEKDKEKLKRAKKRK